MSTTFPRTRGSKRGYSVAEVEEFLQAAREAYTVGADGPAVIDAQAIRTTAFTLQRGGYSPDHVDAALERLEDAFAARERESALAQPGGDTAWYDTARATAQTILNRLDRPYARRFDRAGALSIGYNVRDVDDFGDRLADYFQRGKAMTVAEVRAVVFRRAKGGYREAQVDLLLDTVISVMLAVR